MALPLCRRIGSKVSPGDEIVEIETSKITNVLEAVAGGTLRRVVANAGEEKNVGALIGVLSDADEDDAAIDAFVAEFQEREVLEQSTAAAPGPETIDVGSQRIRYQKAACPGEGGGVPVVLLHGFGGDLGNWMFNQSALAQSRDAYAVDLPGHGGSSKTLVDGSLESLADSVVAWADAVGLKEFHLVGHSMGAAVAQAVALRAPDRVRSLALLCAPTLGERLNRDYVEGFVTAQRRKDLQPFIGMLFADPALVTREMLDDLVAYKRRDGVPQALRELADVGLGERSIAALAAKLSGLSVPTLAIYGARDQIVQGTTPATAGVETEIIKDCGHMPHLEAAETVNALLAGFLGRRG
jgi:Predicted hydrolases or acyltransferases (alpha/beta hydrolase superfamily)